MGNKNDLERLLKSNAERVAKNIWEQTGQDAVVQTYGDDLHSTVMDRFAEQVAQTLDRIAADMGITLENAHEHELRQWVAPGGRWHYSIDGEVVMIVDPETRSIKELTDPGEKP